MKCISRYTVAIFVATFCYHALPAQVDTAMISSITSYVRYIDSLASYDRQTLVMISIEEGPMSLVLTTFNPHTKKTDTIGNVKHGGFGKYSTLNARGDTLYRIHYHDNIDKNFYEQYYFRHHQLVYAKIYYEEDNTTQHRFYYREAYYHDNILLQVNESTQPINEFYCQKVDIDLLEKARKYLEKFEATQRYGK